MPHLLGIGEFAQATHLSIKTLRRYHESGLLQPAGVNLQTGYRTYTTAQIPTAQIIRRFRELDMPLDEIRAVLNARDLRARNDLISAHLARLEENLARTTSVIASLRDLLDQSASAPSITLRRIEQTSVASITEVLDAEDALAWLQGALENFMPRLRSNVCRSRESLGVSFPMLCFRKRAERPRSSYLVAVVFAN